jgi:acyl carrier protein
MMTPRMAASPHAAEDAPLSPFNLQTPHTPLYLLSPSADAAAYALGGGGGGLPSCHSSVEVLASRGATGAGLSPEALQSLVAEQVAAVLGGAVGPDDPLMAAGLDSLGATELQQGLADSLGLELPSTLVFDYPTVSSLAAFLSARLAQGQLAAPGSALPSPAPSSPSALARSMHHGAAGGAAAELLGAAGQHELRLARPGSDASSRVPYGRWDADSPLITRDGTLPAQVGAAGSLGWCPQQGGSCQQISGCCCCCATESWPWCKLAGARSWPGQCWRGSLFLLRGNTLHPCPHFPPPSSLACSCPTPSSSMLSCLALCAARPCPWTRSNACCCTLPHRRCRATAPPGGAPWARLWALLVSRAEGLQDTAESCGASGVSW